MKPISLGTMTLLAAIFSSCGGSSSNNPTASTTATNKDTSSITYLSQPLVKDIYTADPSAHVFNEKIYIYPSHDIESGTPEDDLGSHFDMKDYHILSMDSVGGKVTDNGVALAIKNITWAGRQLWAPDVAFKSGTYYLYFPVKDKTDVFRLGVATSTSPTGPFKPQPEPMKGSYSIDPAVFTDDDGSSYIYWGGIWGGQLQRWQGNKYDSAVGNTDLKKDDALEIAPRVAKLTGDMLQFAEPVKEALIIDSATGKPLLGGDHDRRYFEGPWMHKWNGKYYFTYSTGDTHFLAYAVGSSPYGPFTYKGTFMNPVQGWTTHHSIIEKEGKWYIFYHDTQLSGKTHLRNVKVTELKHLPNGSIELIDTWKKS